ncbi:DUF3108 domain-containing protein [Verminephrobacter aporrectodeae subsp. tuberculatae]|uniref:DUF3108 domain-containing protein n=1 Tax=Verminephrobacter aporrectodeae subsp. tuberculatae TaxID=1110392 RepID=A0ABT3KY18_9BURK|nr:DUF3108 domain-containing protein [Verminephrobacter aporrectodeae]MCW5323234.1 DUF3108 domain-containing protein [Verminephrobacter aporrectodeae subsp. tuberculatae]
MRRRALFLSTALVLLLHALVLGWVFLSWKPAVQSVNLVRVFDARSIAAPPPVAPEPPAPRPAPAPRRAARKPQVQVQVQAPNPGEAQQPPPPAGDWLAGVLAEAPDPDPGAASGMASAAPDSGAGAAPAPDPPDPPQPAAPAQDAGANGDPPGAAPLPILPAPARLAFRVGGQTRKLSYHARAELLWQHDGSRYAARQEVGAFLLGSRTQSSEGRITPQGLRPERFSEHRRGSVQTADFDHAGGRVVFSAATPAEAAVDPGAQDRLSLFIQLGALLAADPQRGVPGTELTLTAVSTRSAERWTFHVEGPETLDLPAGHTVALRLRRLPRDQNDQQAVLWLAPALDYLPVRIRLTQANGDFADLQLSGRSAP